jgi:HD superfamily phosphohydrolase YqeK
VEEEHRRHSLVIQNGIKKMFMIKLKDQRYKAAVSHDYAKSLPGLKDIYAKKRAEKEALLAEISEKKSKLENIGREISERNREYGQLE